MSATANASLRPSHLAWVGSFHQDLVYGSRLLLRSPGFTILAVLTLGAAMGSAAIMFSIINSILLLPLPYKDPSRLVRLISIAPSGSQRNITPQAFLVLKKFCDSFDGLAAIETRSSETLTDHDAPEQIGVMAVSRDFFEVLGAVPAFGRLLQPRDFSQSKLSYGNNLYDDNVAVLNYSLWETRYGGDKHLIGKSVKINGKSVTVVGVTAPDFDLSDPPGFTHVDCWIPREFGSSFDPHSILVVGKIRKDRTIRQAQVEVNSAANMIQERQLEPDPQQVVKVISFHESVVGAVKPQLFVLFGAVLLVLLIACANITNLLIARALARNNEMAVRSALGASRCRLVLQFLSESILLCFMGASLGILFAFCAKNAVMLFIPKDLPRLTDISIDFRALAFACSSALIIGLICGFVPALLTSVSVNLSPPASYLS